MFVLKVQSAINPFKRTPVGKYLNMTWVRYYPEEEKSIFKLLEILGRELVNVFKSKQPEINLVDPQKRLEDTLTEMNKQTNDAIKSIKNLFNSQVGDVEAKLNNSQVRVEDGLNEMSRNTSTYLDQLFEQMGVNAKNYLQKIEEAETKFETNIERLSSNVLNEFNYSKIYVEDRLGKIESKLDSLIQQSFRATNSNLDSMNSSIVDQLRNLVRRLAELEERVSRGVVESSRTVSGQLASLKSESIDSIRTQLTAFRDEMRLVQRNVEVLIRAIGAEQTSSKPSGASSRADRWG